MSQLVKVQIRCQSGCQFVVEIDSSSTVFAFKEQLALRVDMKPSQQRLVFKGKVLTDNEKLEKYAITQDSIIHCIKTTGSVGGSVGGGGFSGLPSQMESFQSHLMSNPDIMSSMFSSPAMQQLLGNQSLMQNLVFSNPQVQQLMDSNPEMKALLSDPQFFQQSVEMMRNPQLYREFVRNSDRALQNIETIPGGYQALNKIYNEIQKPLEEAVSSGIISSSSNPTPAATTLGTGPIPNPFTGPPSADAPSLLAGSPTIPTDMWSGVAAMMQDPSMQQMMNSFLAAGTKTGSAGPAGANLLGNLFDSNALRAFQKLEEEVGSGLNGGTGPLAPNFSDFIRFSTSNKEVLYKSQLAQLRAMGFDDVSMNIEALDACNGEVGKSVDWLVEKINQNEGPL